MLILFPPDIFLNLESPQEKLCVLVCDRDCPAHDVACACMTGHKVPWDIREDTLL